MKMSPVQDCSASDCAFNKNQVCHALAINIGGPSGIPYCDTYTSSDEEGGDAEAHAGVGACKVAACEYNTHLECTASTIEVGFKQNKVACLTFENK